MMVGQNNCQTFKDHFAQEYWRYHICKIARFAAHGHGASENHVHETDTHMMTVDALQELKKATMDNKEPFRRGVKKIYTPHLRHLTYRPCRSGGGGIGDSYNISIICFGR